MQSPEVSGFLNPTRVFSRDEVLSRPSVVPAASGVYGWWFRAPPALIDATGCSTHNGLTLLYVGISPRHPPATGQAASQQNMRQRLRTHYAGNAEASTLRKTLGCLLADQLGIQLRRVGSGRRKTFAEGEQLLSAWMGENAFVNWTVQERPWELEHDLITTLDLPLNLEGNIGNRFHPELTRIRAWCVAQANALPILPKTGRDDRPPEYTESVPSGWSSERETYRGHAFISYVREDSHHVDELQRRLEEAGVPVWRDTADLWPGEDWRAKIRRAITDNALAFIVCFSHVSLARGKSYQNEELTLAIEQMRLHSPDDPWLIPVRFDGCEIPDRDIGGGRMLSSIQRVDLFGDRAEEGIARLITSVLRILGRNAHILTHAARSYSAAITTQTAFAVNEGINDLSALVRELVADVDLLDDDQGQVEDLARGVAGSYADAAISDALSQIGAALEDDVGPLIWRRLVWFGRQLLRLADARLNVWGLEKSVKATPRGMAALLTEPTIWNRCPDVARRRCLTVLIGPLDSTRSPDPRAIQLLAPLLRIGALSDSEDARVRTSFDLAPYDLLIKNGATLDLLVPSIVADLDSGDFDRQNPAARFIRNLSPAEAEQAVHPDLDFRLGAALVDAATGTYRSYGADEAVRWPYVSTWPPSRLAGGIWAALSGSDGRYLRRPDSKYFPDLIAAATGKDVLNEVLTVVREKLNTSLEPSSDGQVGAGKDLQQLATRYTGSDQQVLMSFGAWLRDR